MAGPSGSKKGKKNRGRPPAGISAGGRGRPPAEPDRPLNEWLHEVSFAPRRIEVFDRWWEFKQGTGARAARWDVLASTGQIRLALASMLLDQAPATRPDGSDDEPGTKAADEFLVLAGEWVPPDAAEEFWERFGRALFGLGEA